ncbi:MAG: flagellar basal body P-ring formation chaperone FlgA [Thiogranum sp.]|nr:flagellar basal body P-ring formation chaperone FlgA [Thiogranum sp.]
MRRSTTFILFNLLAVLLALPVSGFAGNGEPQWQDHAAIRNAAQKFLEEFADDHHEGRSEVRLGQLDSRLKLKACISALEAAMPRGGREIGNTTVSVRCNDQQSWGIFITARIDVYSDVLVTRHPLTRGDLVQKDDFERVERNLADLPYGYYSDSAALVGMLTRRTIAAATVVTPQMLQAPKLVKRGELVTVIAETGALSIRTAGKALSDGRSGDMVRVRSAGSNKEVNGVVVSQGVVKVTL